MGRIARSWQRRYHRATIADPRSPTRQPPHDHRVAGLSPARAAWHAPDVKAAAHELAIDWPAGLSFGMGTWAHGLRWGMAPGEVGIDARHPERADDAVVARRYLEAAAVIEGVPLSATLVFELAALVRIELIGRLDALGLAALGASEATLDDIDHHRIIVGRTRVTIDLLDGLIALEPEEAL